MKTVLGCLVLAAGLLALGGCTTSGNAPPQGEGPPPADAAVSPPPAGAGELPVAKGPVVSQGEMPAFCVSQAAAAFAVNAATIEIPGGVYESNGGYALDGKYSKGGDKTFTCRFDGRGAFVDVIATGSGGVI